MDRVSRLLFHLLREFIINGEIIAPANRFQRDCEVLFPFAYVLFSGIILFINKGTSMDDDEIKGQKTQSFVWLIRHSWIGSTRPRAVPTAKQAGLISVHSQRKCA